MPALIISFVKEFFIENNEIFKCVQLVNWIFGNTAMVFNEVLDLRIVQLKDFIDKRLAIRLKISSVFFSMSNKWLKASVTFTDVNSMKGTVSKRG